MDFKEQFKDTVVKPLSQAQQPSKGQKAQQQKMNLAEEDMEDLPYLETLNFRSKLTEEVTTPVANTTPMIREFGIPTSLNYTLPPPTPDTDTGVAAPPASGSELRDSTDVSSLGPSYSSQSNEDIFSLSEDFEEDEDKFSEPRWLLGPQPLSHEGKMTVVLDMDETLVHSEFLNGEDYNYRQEEDTRHTANNNGPDFFLDVCDGVAVHTRPWLTDFLEQLAKHFEVGIFTAAEEVYAGPVLDTIDPNGLIAFRLYRDSTVEFQGTQFVKDLSRLGRDLRRTVLVDNNLQATLASPDNSLMIEDYYGDNSDMELKRILSLLRRLDRLDDIRPMLRSRYQNEDYDWELDNIDAEFL